MAEKPKCALIFKTEITENGNEIKVANIAGTLLSLTDRVWNYTNSKNDVINYKLARISFVDKKGVTFIEEGVKVYEASYSQGMAPNNTYLGRVSRGGKNADGSDKTPWVTLYSVQVGTTMSDSDYEDYVPASELNLS
jgi:hypothetical protein